MCKLSWRPLLGEYRQAKRPLDVKIEAPDLNADVNIAQAVMLRRPRVLYLSQDPQGSETHLMQALNAALIRRRAEKSAGRRRDASC